MRFHIRWPGGKPPVLPLTIIEDVEPEPKPAPEDPPLPPIGVPWEWLLQSASTPEIPLVDGTAFPALYRPDFKGSMKDCRIALPIDPRLELTDARSVISRVTDELAAGNVHLRGVCVHLEQGGVAVHSIGSLHGIEQGDVGT